MKKRLLLTLLPLAFLVAACGGGSGDASSAQDSSASSKSSASTTSAAASSSSAAGTSSAASSSSEAATTSEEDYSSSEEETTSASGDASEWYVVGEGSYVSGTEWDVSGGVNLIVNPTSEDPNAVTEQWATITFAAGDIWKVTNGTIWIQMNCVEAESPVITGGAMEAIDDGFGGKNVSVVTAGAYSIYFKTYADANSEGTSGYSVWVQAA